MKIALAHDYLTQYGGAERVLISFRDLYPHAPIYTLLYHAQKVRGAFDEKSVKTSFLQHVPLAKKHHRAFLFFMPTAIEQFDFSPYDVVLSDSASYAKGVITTPQTLHICYCHTPLRYAWDDSQKYIREFPLSGVVRAILPFFISYIRIWDRQAALRVDRYIANSRFVAGRIQKYYKRDAEVIYPPVDTAFFRNETRAGNYFLMVGRLLSYKKFDLGVKVFNRLGLPLKIVGNGPELRALKRMAGPNIEFLGEMKEKELRDVYIGSRALIFPQEEDFGLVSAEALAAGRPVIAYAGGGALEMVVDGANGVLFKEQSEDSLADAIRRFELLHFDEAVIRDSASKFDKEVFRERIGAFVSAAWAEHKKTLESQHSSN
jgi:glycosyltransferase involved in cell wall biosynthesis